MRVKLVKLYVNYAKRENQSLLKSHPANIFPMLYPRIGTGLGSSLRGVFKNLASFTAYWVSIKVKAFTLELAKVEVKT